MSEDVIVYTCVTGGYEPTLMPATGEPGLRFVCFTDHPEKIDAPGWEKRPLESPDRLTSGHDINRFHKIFAHRLFPDARWSIYLDGSIVLTGNLRDLVDAVERQGAALGAFWHPNGHGLRGEAELCRQYRFDRRDCSLIEEQLEFYRHRGLDLEAKTPMNGVLVRDHSEPNLELAMNIWWAQLFKFTQRDQISLTYSLREAGVPWVALDGDGGIDRGRLSIRFHRRPFMQRVQMRLRRQFGWMPRG